jgi:predicted RNA-binding protein with PIN domain
MDRAGGREIESMIDAEFSRARGRVILVDGFNVLHAVLLGKEREDGWWRREFRERLLRRISVWQSGSDEIWVAFDGAEPAWSVWAEPIAVPKTSDAKSTIVHSVFVESADDWIVRRARRASHPDQTIVVSGDRKVTGRARSAGCEIWTPWAFISRCPTLEEGQSDHAFA